MGKGKGKAGLRRRKAPSQYDTFLEMESGAPPVVSNVLDVKELLQLVKHRG